MLLDNIEKYYSKSYDLNCAETILYAANETYGLGLDKRVLKLAAGFGGGMNIDGTCGALLGAVMVLSLMFVKDRAHESDRIKVLEKELFEKYRKKMGHLDCPPLKQKYRTEEDRCLQVVKQAGAILEEIVKRESSEG
ncbi:C-GCAxxG-C-C family (seleno)protein [Thermosediminibacter litoriperuensis]|uniref:C_GCAxxG_C_C family probable redox protein n=1 Tax=Thermosediminibacter litoriperuensis TaxID=291989 RepID=A0A5S5AZ11_9FIRM|nr:C-GCAxxG-C-C family (seleno)protein [Thermosediminibacter litoriperuensis]TYP59951.1 C_GCAxxG_C_C family probable redox protein [Thermosediminibacter litoriperuensis]